MQKTLQQFTSVHSITGSRLGLINASIIVTPHVI